MITDRSSCKYWFKGQSTALRPQCRKSSIYRKKITHIPTLLQLSRQTTKTLAFTSKPTTKPLKCSSQRNAATAAAASTAVASYPPATAWLFAGSSIYVLALTLLMVLAPRWQQTRKLMKSPLSLVLPAIAYGVLLAWSWQPDTFSIILPGSWQDGLKGGFNPQFFPKLAGVSTLFSRVGTAASLWVHLLAVNLFAARAFFLDGWETGVPTWHSVLLCMFFAPLGVLSHALTKMLFTGSNNNSTA